MSGLLTLKHAKKIKTCKYARVVKSLPHTKLLSPHSTKCMVCVVCCETFVKIFFIFYFWGKLQRGGWKATSSTYTFQNEVVLPLIFPLCKILGE
jgi:hypothetical protein